MKLLNVNILNHINITDRCVERKLRFSFFITLLFLISCKEKEVVLRNTYDNVIFILADDLGKEVLSIYGGESTYKTPNLDKLAETSSLFDNCYANPICAPSRAELISGLYPSKNGFVFNTRPGERLDHSPSLGNLFKDRGYSTGAVGKWHLADLSVYPDHINQFGFDSYFVHKMWDGVNNDITSRYFNPTYFSTTGTERFSSNSYGPDLELSFAKTFILKNRETPYFLYYAMNLPHGPYTSPPSYPINTSIDDYENIANYEYLVEYMDTVLGELIIFLKEIGDYDNTLIIFTSDNGCPAEHSIYRNGQLIKGGKATLKETGINVPLLVKYPFQTQAYRVDRLVDFTDFIPTFKDYIQYNQFPPTDGKSFLDIIDKESEKLDEREWIFSMVLDQWAIRNKESKVYWNGNSSRLEAFPDEVRMANPTELEDKLFIVGDSIANRK